MITRAAAAGARAVHRAAAGAAARGTSGVRAIAEDVFPFYVL